MGYGEGLLQAFAKCGNLLLRVILIQSEDWPKQAPRFFRR